MLSRQHGRLFALCCPAAASLPCPPRPKLPFVFRAARPPLGELPRAPPLASVDSSPPHIYQLLCDLKHHPCDLAFQPPTSLQSPTAPHPTASSAQGRTRTQIRITLMMMMVVKDSRTPEAMPLALAEHNADHSRWAHPHLWAAAASATATTTFTTTTAPSPSHHPCSADTQASHPAAAAASPLFPPPPPITSAAAPSRYKRAVDMDDLCNSLSSLQWLVDLKCDSGLAKGLPSPSCPSSPRAAVKHLHSGACATTTAAAAAASAASAAAASCSSAAEEDEAEEEEGGGVDSALEEELLHNDKWRTDTATKPPVGYATLIYLALKSAGKDKLSLGEIYAFIKDHFAYYAVAEPGWKNSIRHNLSSHKCFKKVMKAEDERGKGGYWSLDENYPAPENKRLKSRKRYQKRPKVESDAFAERLRNPKKDDSPILKRKNKKLLAKRPSAEDLDFGSGSSVIDWPTLHGASDSPAAVSRRANLLFAGSPYRPSESGSALSLDDDVDITSLQLQSMENFAIDADGDLELALVGKKCRIYDTAPALTSSFNVFAIDQIPMSENHSPVASLNSSFTFHNGFDASALFFSPTSDSPSKVPSAALDSLPGAAAAAAAAIAPELDHQLHHQLHHMEDEIQDAITAMPADWL